MSYSTLYADDLAVYFTYTADGALLAKVNKYIKKLEEWLRKNRLEMNVAKTCYCIFTRSNKATKEYDFKMNGQTINHDSNPKFLGVIMDERVTFSAHVEHIRDKCSSRLNVIRIVAHKSWKLSKRTLTNIYKALVGSVIDYSALIGPFLSSSRMKQLQAVQNKAMRTIYKRPYDSHTDELCQLSNCPRVKDRMHQLAVAHVDTAKHSNPLIALLIRDYTLQLSSIRRHNTPPTTLCHILNNENNLRQNISPHHSQLAQLDTHTHNTHTTTLSQFQTNSN